MQLNSSSPSPAGLGAAPRTPKPATGGGLAGGSMPCRAWLGWLDSGQEQTKSCPKATLLSHEAGALLVQIPPPLPFFVRNAIPTLLVQACLQGKGGDTCFRHNVWLYFFFPST